MADIEISEGRRRFYTEDFTGGNNMFIHPTKLPENEFPVFENVMVRAIGGASGGNYFTADKRKGFERYNTNQIVTGGNPAIKAIGEYITRNKTTNLQRLLANNADSLLVYTDITGGEYTGTWNLISGTETNTKLKYTTMNDNLYICNRNAGADVNKFYDGTNYLDMGCAPCDNNLGVSNFVVTAGGNMDGGNYFYLFTFVYENQQESSVLVRTSGASSDTPQWTDNTATITTGSGNYSLTINNIPTGNARVTKRNIYRSKHDDWSLVYYAGSILDNTTTTYYDEVADDDLSEGFDPYLLMNDLKRSFKSKYQCVHDKKMIQFSVTDDLYKPIPSSAITLTENTTNHIISAGTYTYKFYKIWAVNAGDKIIFKISQPVTKSITLATKSTVDINITGDGWFNAIAIQRTSIGGTDFKFIQATSPLWQFQCIYGIPPGTTINDQTTDIARFGTQMGWKLTTTDKLIFPNKVTWSDIGSPDLFTAGNEINIGDSNDEITGGFSRYSAIDVFKRNTIYRIMTATDIWQGRKIANIGAAYPESIVQMPDETYVFCGKKKIGTTEYPVFYEWDGNNAPREISTKIQAYLDSITISDIDGCYDNTNKCIRFVYTTGSYKGEELVYDLIQRDTQGIGLWYFNHRNAADLELRCPFYTNGNKLLYGNESGYLMHQGANNQDTLGASNTVRQINVRLQSRTHEVSSGALKIKRLMSNIVTSGAGTGSGLGIICGIDETEYPSTGTLAAGENRIRIGCNINARRFYIRYEDAENINLKFRMMGWDYAVRHIRSAAGYGVSAPGQVTLVSPGDGTSGIDKDNADLSWNVISGTYHLQVASDAGFTTILFDQDKIKYLNFTIPNSILAASTTYYWRVRAFDGMSYGAWSTVRSFSTASAGGFEAETTALLARMVTPPDSTRQNLINALILGLKTDGIWAKLDGLYLFNAHTNGGGEALLNWISNSLNATITGSIVFNANFGFTGDSTTGSYVNIPVTLSSGSYKYQLNSASIGFWLGRVYNTANYQEMGSMGSTFIYPTLSQKFYACINNSSIDFPYTQYLYDPRGFIILSRTASNAAKAYYEGGIFQTSAGASTALPTGTAIKLCYQSPREESAFFFGQGLTDTDVYNLYGRLNTYMCAVGTRVGY